MILCIYYIVIIVSFCIICFIEFLRDMCLTRYNRVILHTQKCASTCYAKLIPRLLYSARNIAIVANYTFQDSLRSFVIFTENQFRRRTEMSLSPVREYPEQTLSSLLREWEIRWRWYFISRSLIHRRHRISSRKKRRCENLEIAHFCTTVVLKL